MDKLLQFAIQHIDVTIVVIGCIIQIAPIKLNPWSALFGWIGKHLTHDLSEKVIDMDNRVADLETKVDTLNTDVLDERVQNKRWSILNFTNSCRRDIAHTREEWEHCLQELKWYEKYCEENDVINGVIEENAAWLRKRYDKHLEDDDFLRD